VSWSLLREVVVHFLDIGGIVDHHCLNFLFINADYLLRDGILIILLRDGILITYSGMAY
jgi:hypothetical protein